jgi:hypothetical protein
MWEETEVEELWEDRLLDYSHDSGSEGRRLQTHNYSFLPITTSSMDQLHWSFNQVTKYLR